METETNSQGIVSTGIIRFFFVQYSNNPIGIHKPKYVEDLI